MSVLSQEIAVPCSRVEGTKPRMHTKNSGVPFLNARAWFIVSRYLTGATWNESAFARHSASAFARHFRSKSGSFEAVRGRGACTISSPLPPETGRRDSRI